MNHTKDDVLDRLSPVAISAGTPASVQIYAFLRDSIIRGVIPADASLSEATLCTWLGVSRQPVREALLRLAGVNLVRTFAQRGSVVTRISLPGLQNAQLIREAVEVEVLRRAMAHKPAAGWGAMRMELSLQRTFLDHGDTDSFYASDERFHWKMGEAGGLTALWTDLETIKVQLDRVRYSTLRSRAKMQSLLDDHTRLLDAIEQGDAEAAQVTLRAHLRRVLADLDRLRIDTPHMLDLT